MNLEKFTEKAQEALQEAAGLARSLGQQAIEPEHLILALIRQQDGVGRTLLERAGVSVQALEPALVSVVERLPRVSGGGQPYISSALQEALDGAEQEADRLKDEYISTEHLLLALADHKALKDAGARHDATRFITVSGSRTPRSSLRPCFRIATSLTASCLTRRST